MSGPPSRRFLGTTHSIGERERVYSTPEALEVDVIESFTIRRRRVFFDEVQLVTLHSKRGVPIEAVFWGVAALIIGLAAVGNAASGSRALVIFFAIAGALALGRLIILLMPLRTVTVFGKRTRARIRFRLRGGEARRVYDEICRTVAEAQAAAAVRLAAQIPQPPPLPPMPTPEEVP